MNEEQRRAGTLAFINQSFRDMADKDYISARILHRHDLQPQFYWAAHQAIEKYLKAILLYNDVSAKNLGHDLRKALGRVEAIPDLTIELPEDVRTLIHRVDDEGPNRYFEYPAGGLGDELLQLDRAVWHVRRYAQWLRGTIWSSDGQLPELRFRLAHLHSIRPHQVHLFKISGGHLERVLERPSAARAQLVWKNFYYGARKKRTILFTRSSWGANPAHYLDHELFEHLSTVVDFSKAIKRVFKSGPIA